MDTIATAEVALHARRVLERVMADGATAAAGRAWYPAARRVAEGIARDAGIETETAAGVIAALSPRVSWRFNQIYAWYVCCYGPAEWRARYRADNGNGAGVTRRNEAAAVRILTSRSVTFPATSPKPAAFWDNIMRPAESVAVALDSWMMREVMGLPADRVRGGVKPAAYHRLADVFRSVAADVAPAEAPCTVQAAGWVAVRGGAE
jgi:hypothetical protein